MAMAEEKRGIVGSILQKVPLVGGSKKEEEGLPEKGPVPTIPNPTGKVVPYKTEPVGSFTHRIKYKGMFDLDGFYRTMALWFKDRRFELHETLYKGKPPELEIRWRAERKRTSFVKEFVNVRLHMLGEYDVDAIVKGKKKKMAKGRLTVAIYADVEAPYEDIFGEKQWTATNIERRLLRLFQGWIFKKELEGLYQDQIYYEVYSLYSTMKGYLKFGTG
jgi:hypothetical protein